jgi:hypothetical protein
MILLWSITSLVSVEVSTKSATWLDVVDDLVLLMTHYDVSSTVSYQARGY